MEPAQLGVILDTSVIVTTERANLTVRQILEQIRSVHGDIEAGLSVVTIAELVHGAYRARTPDDQRSRMLFIDELCRDVPVFPMTLPIARLVGQIEGQQATRGVRIPFEDLVIGATALHLGYAISTLNLRHFSLVPGLAILSA